ncbi:putative metallo-hydrolase [Saliniradius amylolyticus]|uniref:Putative metallo-hydrolase n=1 Tax=Saliniradius amylolyticus TaxID=2183582 RepID=A0A2S2E5G5_9ALTE|nr:MBL fold metallo-hydrolase [Saliniradius amylolyticus]AWL12470.1 putative metallo-hydrolase [Saliniradius amylolyticus]
MTINVQHFYHEDTGTLTYVIHEPSSAEAAVIDPVLDFDYAAGRTDTTSIDAIVAYLRQNRLTLKWVLETHAHADHLTAAQHLKKQLGGTIAIGRGITQVQSTFCEVFNLGEEQDVTGRDFDHLFAEGEHFSLGSVEGQILATPGHTNDSISYVIDGNAFVGDTLFMPDAGTARCDFPGGSASLLYQSIQKLYALGDEIKIWACHDYKPEGRELRYMATVAEHKANNIHVNADTSEAAFVEKREARDATLAMPRLIVPSIQVNIRAGLLPEPESNGVRYLKVPLNHLGCT